MSRRKGRDPDKRKLQNREAQRKWREQHPDEARAKFEVLQTMKAAPERQTYQKSKGEVLADLRHRLLLALEAGDAGLAEMLKRDINVMVYGNPAGDPDRLPGARGSAIVGPDDDTPLTVDDMAGPYLLRD
jgi:hypothetical protein